MVSVIIPNLNGDHLLRPCLLSLAEGSVAPAQVILVDNASIDRSLDVARAAYPEVDVIANETNVGFAAACNQGARIASQALLLFLNSDVVVSERCLAELLDWASREPDAAVWQPKLLRDDGESWDSAGSYFTGTGFLWHEGLGARGAGLYPEARDVFSVKGACMLVRREAFEHVGGFDESFFAYFEETDICWRLQLAGWRVRVVPASPAFHGVGATTQRMFAAPEVDRLSFRNRLASIVANAGAGTLIRVLPVHVALSLATAVVFATRGKPQNARAIVSALAYTATRFSSLRARRRRSQALRRRADRDFLPTVTVQMSPRRARQLLSMYLLRW